MGVGVGVNVGVEVGMEVSVGETVGMADGAGGEVTSLSVQAGRNRARITKEKNRFIYSVMKPS